MKLLLDEASLKLGSFKKLENRQIYVLLPVNTEIQVEMSVVG